MADDGAAGPVGIAIEGIVDRRWARALDRFSGGDGVVHYWINRRGSGGAVPISRVEARFIRRVFSRVDQVTGLRLVEKRSRRASDIDVSNVVDLGGSTIGLARMRRGWFELFWEDRIGSGLSRGERRTITHEIGHAFGLDHPFGSGFNPLYDTSDTIMSYNTTRNSTFTASDVRALQFLWGA
ncbi:reprolysin-like metallopeptidase [Cyanobium sp. NIES-981]|uniref:reprolysin-like metallopeptidase n=1 Tax=Cyanobium sp. NIES-981 TaxID=1851505 RepID=UPI0007DD0856|nr:hypothetical protein [Cyanobium sp. NIES-981]SBO44442.1 conserved protein of unknown function [Cyanobium sp. NIES-981]